MADVAVLVARQFVRVCDVWGAFAPLRHGVAMGPSEGFVAEAAKVPLPRRVTVVHASDNQDGMATWLKSAVGQ